MQRQPLPIINDKIKFELKHKSHKENNSEETTVSHEKNRFIHVVIDMRQMDGMYEETKTKLTDLYPLIDNSIDWYGIKYYNIIS